jgi:hypothetical protein
VADQTHSNFKGKDNFMKEQSRHNLSRPDCLIEPLERRALLSATWSTVDSDPAGQSISGMAADKAGNVYAVGADIDGNATLRQESGGHWTTVLVQNDNGSTHFNRIATDAANDVFIAGNRVAADGTQHWSVWERGAGQSGLTLIDDLKGNAGGIATNSAGDVYVAGRQTLATTTTVRGKTTTTTTNYGTIRKLAPTIDGFVASTVYQNSGNGLSTGGNNVAVIESGPSAGVYVVGTGAANSTNSSVVTVWDVLKSTDGGGHWGIVDQYQSNANYSDPICVCGDGIGDVFVAGSVQVTVITGYSHNKPVYGYDWHGLVRKSGSGNSGSWSTTDDFNDLYSPAAIGADTAGNVYVVGSNGADGIIRTNAGGGWSTSDDYAGGDGGGAEYNAFVTDSSGTLYAGGDDDAGTFVRSSPSLAAPTPTPAATFSLVSIAAAVSSANVTIFGSEVPEPQMMASAITHR